MFSCAPEKKESDVEEVRKSYRHFRQLVNEEKYDQALSEINKLISIEAEEKNDRPWLHFIVQKAELLRMLSDLDAAYELLQQQSDKVNQMEHGQHTAYYFNRKAAILYELKEMNAALKAVKQAQRIDSIIGSKNWRYSSSLSIEGSIYRDLGQDQKAQEVLKKAASFAFEENDMQEYILSVYNLMLSFQRSENYDSIPFYAEKIIGLDALKQDINQHHRTLNILAESYEKLGMHDSAFFHANHAYHLAHENTLNVIDDRLKMYTASEELTKEKLVNELLEAKNKRQLLVLILILSVAIGIGLFTLLVYRQRSQYKRLSESKQSINAQLKESLAFNNKLISVVAHDIRNPLANITSVIELYRMGELDEQTVNKIMLQLESASKSAGQLLENLLRWVKTQESDFSPQYAQINLSKLIVEVIQEVKIQQENKKITLRTDFQDINLESDPDFLRLILRNLLTNAIKFSKTAGEISITAILAGNSCHIEIQDQGVGISAERIKLLHSGQHFSESGTKDEKGTGLGLRLVNELIKTLGGELRFQSEEGKGTKAKVSIPIR
jgi:signal transduction histidine kinase